MDLSMLENEYNFIEIDSKWDLMFDEARYKHERNEYECNIALLEKNRPLNRYKNALPYDHSRIVLRDYADTDYINANLVEYEAANVKYILTQGPKLSTCEHFWQMIWQERPKGIIMLNKLIEMGAKKCDPYFPSLEDDEDGNDELTKRFGKFEIEFLDEQLNTEAYTIRKFNVINTEVNEHFDIYHLQYLNWPDFEEADDRTFLKFLFECYRLNLFSDSNYGPPVIHCSAGLGRSGTFVLVHACLELYKLCGNRLPCGILDVLLELRKYRMGLIQTSNQLKFAFKAIIDGIKFQENPSGLYSDSQYYDDDEEDEDVDSESSDIEIKDSDKELKKLHQHLDLSHTTTASSSSAVSTSTTSQDVEPPVTQQMPQQLLHLDLGDSEDDSAANKTSTNDTSFNTYESAVNETNRSVTMYDSFDDTNTKIAVDDEDGDELENDDDDDDEILFKRNTRDVSTVKVNVPRAPLNVAETTEVKEETRDLSREEADELRLLLRRSNSNLNVAEVSVGGGQLLDASDTNETVVQGNDETTSPNTNEMSVVDANTSANGVVEKEEEVASDAVATVRIEDEHADSVIVPDGQQQQVDDVSEVQEQRVEELAVPECREQQVVTESVETASVPQAQDQPVDEYVDKLAVLECREQQVVTEVQNDAVVQEPIAQVRHQVDVPEVQKQPVAEAASVEASVLDPVEVVRIESEHVDVAVQPIVEVVEANMQNEPVVCVTEELVEIQSVEDAVLEHVQLLKETLEECRPTDADEADETSETSQNEADSTARQQQSEATSSELRQRPTSPLQVKQQRISTLVQQMKTKQVKHEQELANPLNQYKPFIIGGGVFLAGFIALKIYKNYFSS